MGFAKVRTDFVGFNDTVVRCRTMGDARSLMKALLSRYPDEKYILDIKLRCFAADADEDGLCYRIRERSGKLYVDHCFASYYENHGWDIIDISDLRVAPDYGEFSMFTDKNDALSTLF